LDQVLELIKDDTFDLKNTKQTLQGLIDTISSSDENVKIQVDLIEYLNELDKRRNQNWRKIFQWLAKYENVV
jgi:hypothetical protein